MSGASPQRPSRGSDFPVQDLEYVAAAPSAPGWLIARLSPGVLGSELVADAIRLAYDYPGTFADSLAPHAARFGLRKGAGTALLGWLLDLTGDPGKERWMDEAQVHAERAAGGTR